MELSGGIGIVYLDGNWKDKEVREELLSKMIHIRETRPITEPRSRKDSSTLKQKKSESKKIRLN